MDKFIGRRISLENLGDSVHDDAIIKQMIREFLDTIGILLQAKNLEELLFNQGKAAALQSMILKMRQIKAQELARESQDDD